MPEEKQQIRNADGKLLCEMTFDGESWNLGIKRGDCFTTLILYPGGSFHVSNMGEDQDIRSVVSFG